MRAALILLIGHDISLKRVSLVKLAMLGTGAWTDSGPETVLSEAQERIKRDGWDPVRRALAITVRLVFLLISSRMNLTDRMG